MSERPLGNLGLLGCEPESSINSKRGLQPSLKVKPTLRRNPIVKSTYGNPLRNSCLQEALHSLLSKQAIELVKVQSSLAFLQLPLLGCQAKQQVAFYCKPEICKQVPKGPNLQNGKSRVSKAIASNRRMGLFSRFQQCLFSHPYNLKLKEVPNITLSESDLPVYSPTFCSVHSSLGVYYYNGKGVKLKLKLVAFGFTNTCMTS